MKEINQRLSKIDLNKEIIFAFNLCCVDNLDVLNEFITAISLFKTLNTSDNTIFLPKHCHILIEISNTFNDSLKDSILYKKYLN